ncbi:MAG: hypothetical protein A2285_04640 [Elusimicrobia bacterium RIFOXYA12_FULL_57_11]|nr:MAG: hypothetical protein A2285_04640 [Elusimicrobia bacterium RIFOXYA12_FULL_57_11]
MTIAARAALGATHLEGMDTAAAAAKIRAAGAVLVEVEGFTDPEGNIPCVGKSFSNVWHYKFYSRSSGGWLIINVCGTEFTNASKHEPENRSEESTKALPAFLADSRTILAKLTKDGAFTGTGTARNREIYLKAAYLPGSDGRPAGCYWTVSQGRTKIFTGCDGKKTWGNYAKTGAEGRAPAKALKGADTAGKYTKLAVDTIRRKMKERGRGQQPVELMLIETLVDKTGSARCIGPDDGWTYTFADNMTFGGCKNKTSVKEVDFDGATGSFNKFFPLPITFKDSDFALSRTPAKCAQSHSTISMKLQNFKPKFTPFAGHNLIWTVDCGTLRYYLDGHTGSYLGPGKK